MPSHLDDHVWRKRAQEQGTKSSSKNIIKNILQSTGGGVLTVYATTHTSNPKCLSGARVQLYGRSLKLAGTRKRRRAPRSSYTPERTPYHQSSRMHRIASMEGFSLFTRHHTHTSRKCFSGARVQLHTRSLKLAAGTIQRRGPDPHTPELTPTSAPLLSHTCTS